MEWWNNGIMGKKRRPNQEPWMKSLSDSFLSKFFFDFYKYGSPFSYPYSNIPVFQMSVLPLFHHSIIPFFQISIPPSFRHSSVPVFSLSTLMDDFCYWWSKIFIWWTKVYQLTLFCAQFIPSPFDQSYELIKYFKPHNHANFWHPSCLWSLTEFGPGLHSVMKNPNP